MDWNLIGVLIALAVALGGVGAQVFNGGRLVQRLDDMKEDIGRIEHRVNEHDGDIADSNAQVAGITAKIDGVKGQLDRALDYLQQLTQRKDH